MRTCFVHKCPWSGKWLVLFSHFLLIPLFLTTLSAQSDSVYVEALLARGLREATPPLHLWYARQFLGTPYVAHTLEVNREEALVVNLRQLDCTTFVETAVALALTQEQGSTQFEDFRANLTRIRYRQGILQGYPSRNHYFTQWISSNEQQGIVREIVTDQPPFTARQTLALHYMSQHPDLYAMLRNDRKAQAAIRRHEAEEDGRTVRYIPRSLLNQPQRSPLGLIHDGDILAIVTRKDGLDTSHIGIAVWGKDSRLHLLNASQLHKKVVLEPMTLYEYMGKHSSQLGVRVVRVLGKEEKGPKGPHSQQDQRY